MNSYTLHIASWRNDNSALRTIRAAVFIQEQGVPVELEWDEWDANCTHVLVRDSEGEPVGTARLLPDGSIGRMAVLKEWRGRGVGRALVQWLLQEAQRRQMQQVALNAQISAVGFYRKFDFQTIGETFQDAGIPHVRMVLRLRD